MVIQEDSDKNYYMKNIWNMLPKTKKNGYRKWKWNVFNSASRSELSCWNCVSEFIARKIMKIVYVVVWISLKFDKGKNSGECVNFMSA